MGNWFLALALILSYVSAKAETCSSYFQPSLITAQVFYKADDHMLIDALAELGAQDIHKPSQAKRIVFLISEDLMAKVRKIPGVQVAIKTEMRDLEEAPRSDSSIPRKLKFSPAADVHLETLEAIRYENYGRKQLQELVLESLNEVLKSQNIYEFSDKDFIEFMDAYTNEQTSVIDILSRIIR